MNSQRLTLLILFSLLGVGVGWYWLATRADYTGPDGTKVYGPQQSQEAGLSIRTFTVVWPEGQLAHNTDYLHGVAWRQVEDASSGEYSMRFLEEGTGRQIASYRFSSVGDLLFATKVTELPH